MPQLEYLFAAIAFTILVVVFLIHYRKMVQLEMKEEDLKTALMISEESKKRLQRSLDRLIDHPDELLSCLKNGTATKEEIAACIKRLMGV